MRQNVGVDKIRRDFAAQAGDEIFNCHGGHPESSFKCAAPRMREQDNII